MAETSQDRLIRLLGMIAYLEAHGSTPFDVLARHFGVSAERVEKDLWMLTTSGVPPYLPDECLEFDFDDLDEGVATLVESQGISQVRLSGREAVALIGALATMIGAGTAPPGAAEVLARIQDAYGAAAPVAVIGEADGLDAGVTATLTGAIEAQQCVSIDYADAQDRRSTRVIEPHRLVAIDGVGYVECWCRKADDYRTLRLGRIAAVMPHSGTVEHPPSESRGFSLEPQFEATVVMRRAGRWGLEDIADARFEEDGDRVTVRFGVSDIEWAASRLLAVGPQLVSVAPAALHDAVRRRALAVLAAHAD